MHERWIFARDYSSERSWELLAWCGSRGVDEFSLSLMGLEGSTGEWTLAWENALREFALPISTREHLTAPPGKPFSRPVATYRLVPSTIAILGDCLPDGLFTAPSYAESGWAEDPTFYRAGELLLGVVSHEGEGILRLTELEATEISAAGFVTTARPDEPWRPWNLSERDSVER